MIRRTYSISGTVQGVGFRPTLYRLAREVELGGWIQNRSGTVLLSLEGTTETIDTFISHLPSRLPPHAAITQLLLTGEAPLSDETPSPFSILKSGVDDHSTITIPADLAMCAACRSEVLDPSNHRYRYPFTTCTNCGPRYTVVHGMPYDRTRTTLATFPLCDACKAEYHDPTNRRFHAESIACPTCGPKARFEPLNPDLKSDSIRSSAVDRPDVRRDDHSNGAALESRTYPAPIAAARNVLAAGGILAIRGIGGYHLAVDATNAEAIKTLRQRKHRPDKPFAIMARNLDAVRSICHLSDDAAALLQSPEAPIVILDLKPQTLNSPQPTLHSPLPTAHISPHTCTLGIMLPTSPLHLLLFEPEAEDHTPRFEFLVMTSGNQNSEPICISNDDAATRLHDIADAMLKHDREINLRNDDSLVAQQHCGFQIWRRARGYAPNSIALTNTLSRSVMAMGAELKNTIALGVDNQVTLSPHIGDLSTPEAIDAQKRVARELPQFLDLSPECIAVDLHPDMHCTRHGEHLAKALDIPIIRVQHHHAHAAACLAENGKSTGLALVFDGTGLGLDGNIWGAELLHVDGPNVIRIATFAPTPLPGGDKAVAEPNRQLVARWNAAGISPAPELLQRCGIQEDQNRVWKQQCSQRINAPLTHAAGRLFDAFSALLGFAPSHTSYEGQAPIRLEAAAEQSRSTASLPFSTLVHGELLSIDWSPAFAELTQQHDDVWRSQEAAKQTHNAITEAAVTMVRFGIERTGETTIALSGGVFMNRLLCSLLIPELSALGLTVITHNRVPPNDGGIALGQAVVAGWQTLISTEEALP